MFKDINMSKKVFIRFWLFLFLLIFIFITIALYIRLSKVEPIPQQQNISVNIHSPSNNIINSSYVQNSNIPYVYPHPSPVGITEKYDPYKIINENDKNMASWVEKEKDKSNVRLEHGLSLPLASMNISLEKTVSGFPYEAVWLDKSRPFEGVWELVSFYPKDTDEPQTFVVKALLDGHEIKLAKKGEQAVEKITLNLKRGEKSLFEFETEPIPLGVHNLNILAFDYTSDITPDPDFQVYLGSQNFRDYPYKVYVGNTNPVTEPEWYDWSTGDNPFPNIRGSLAIIDLEKTKRSTGLAYWQPGIFQFGQNIEYDVALTNNDKGDREYCLIAFLDYNIIPIKNGKKQVCGIVKDNQLGLLHTSITIPLSPGKHSLQIVEIENPLMKDDYLKDRPKETLTQYRSSGRVLIEIRP